MSVASDTERMVVLSAEHELEVITILAAHAGLTDVAADRIAYSLWVISDALTGRRAEVGLQRLEKAA